MKTAVFRASKWAFHQVPPWLFRWRPFTIFAIQLPGPSGPASSADVRLAWATAREHSLLHELSNPTLVADHGNSRAAVAWKDDVPIGITWVANQSWCERELGLEFRLHDSDAWLFASHVLAAHRRQGVYSNLLRFVCRELKNQGKSRLLLGTTNGNTPSWAAHESAGAQAVGGMLAARVCSAVNLAKASGNVVNLSHGLRWGRNLCQFEISPSYRPGCRQPEKQPGSPRKEK